MLSALGVFSSSFAGGVPWWWRSPRSSLREASAAGPPSAGGVPRWWRSPGSSLREAAAAGARAAGAWPLVGRGSPSRTPRLSAGAPGRVGAAVRPLGGLHLRRLPGCCGDVCRRLAAVSTTEAAWHRRARRQRQSARAILAVDRARRLLAAHHGGGGSHVHSLGGGGCGGARPIGMPNGHGPGFTNWDCMVCGKEDNAGWRTRCRNCSAYPMHGARRPKGAGKGGGGKNNSGGNKGKGAGKNGYAAYSSNSNNEGNNYPQNTTFAERQLQKQRTQEAIAAQKSSERQLQDQRRRNEMLQEQNRKLLREVTAVRSGKGDLDDDDEMEEGPEDISTEERKARIEKIRASLPYLEEHCGLEPDMYKDAV